jgi:KDO2-lipid IV(A) lauroyltransferase
MTRGVLLGYAEIVHVLRRPDRAPDVVEFRGLDELNKRAADGKGAILAAGHFGSFDLCLMALGKMPGLDVSCIVRSPTHPQVAAFIERARSIFEVGLIEPRDSTVEIDRRLNAGGTVVFVVDQRHRAGVKVPFFGQPALTAPSVVAFARRLDVPVVPAIQWRVGLNRHVVQILPSLDLQWTDDREEDLRSGLALIHAAFEKQIRLRPHGWLWWHRRWAD